MPLFLSEKSKNLEQRAEQLSMRLGHYYLGCEHFFLATIDGTQWLSEILEEEGIDIEELRERILNICGPGDENPLWKGIIVTPRMKKIFKLAEREAESKRAYRVEPNHIISAICREGRSIPARVLESMGGDLSEIRRMVLDIEEEGAHPVKAPFNRYIPISGSPYSAFIARKGKTVPPADVTGKRIKKDEPSSKEKKYKKKIKTPTLDKLGRDLVQMAREGKIDPIVGRKDEIRRMLQTLTKKAKNNPIIIGEAGVGKTAVVYGLAQRIADGKVPEAIKSKRIVELGMASIVAGTKHRGEFEERMQKIIKEVQSDPDIIIFIDEIHTIMGAGDSRGVMDAGNILKPYLARGEITIIGATTIDEYRRFIEKDPALERRFQPILVNEPTEEETIEILNGLKERYEKHHGVKFTPEAIRQAVKFAVRYIPDRNLPDKAIDLMDEAAARSQMSFASYSGDDEEKIEKITKEVTEEDIAEVVSLWTGIPVAKLSQEESERLLHLEDYLRQRVVGQEEAVKRVAETIRVIRTGLASPNRPGGVFLFLGPTGVGKTELAKSLAEFLFGSEKDMIRLDMSEYMEKHSISRMIGSPPGYVGHEEEGQLTKAVRTKPYSVVLLDEIEKAHPDVFDLFLQVFDDGRMTDGKGRTVNFTNTIIIMTSNIGTSSRLDELSSTEVLQAVKEYIEETGSIDAMGFRKIMEQFVGEDASTGEKKVIDTTDPKVRQKMLKALRKHFRPEFLNRIDEIIIFNPLSEEALWEIAKMNVKKLQDQLYAQREIHLDVREEAIRFLMEKGYDPSYGARPMKRAIQNFLAKPLAEAMLSKGVNKGDTIIVTSDGNQLMFYKGDEEMGLSETLSPDDIPPKGPQGNNGTHKTPKPPIDIKKPSAIPEDHPLKQPPSKRKPILKKRFDMEGIHPMMGPFTSPSEKPPEDLDPEDFQETKPRYRPPK